MSERSERIIITVRRRFGGAVIGALPVGPGKFGAEVVRR
jgi:hypothetical protein